MSVAQFYDILASKPFTWIPTIQDLLPQLYISMKVIPTGGHPDKFLDRETLLKGYELHYNNVRQAIPPERLLEYNVKEGWEPLCTFLKVPVPDVPFPHVNDRFKVQVIMNTLSLITWIWPLLFVGLPLALLYILYRYCFAPTTKNNKIKST